jgi:hypothetical protein
VSATIRPIGIALLLALATACTNPTDVEVEPDPAAVPSGDPVAQGAEAIGPITVIGDGQAFDLGWRYVTYESADGWCTQLELAEVTSTGCGDVALEGEDDHLTAVVVEEPLSNGATPVTGITSDEIVTVFLIDEARGRVPGRVMSLEEAGREGQAFIGFAPPDWTVTHVQAVVLSGDILETYEVP